MNGWRVLLLLIVFASGLSAWGDEQQPRVFAHANFMTNDGALSQDAAVHVGEKVTLVLDIYTSQWFPQSPEVLPFSVDDAIVLRVEKFATNFSDTLAGESFAVQRREYLIFPQRSGPFVVPGIELQVATPGQERTVHLRTEPLLLSANTLPESAIPGRILVADSVELTEHYANDNTTLKVGDALERHIRIEASEVPAMLIAPPPWPPVASVRQQSSHQSRRDRVNRGELVGHYTETRHYLFEKPGTIKLPPLQLRWWQSPAGEWRTATLPARELQIAEGPLSQRPAMTLANLLQTMSTHASVITVLIAVLAISLLLWIKRSSLSHRWRQFKHSEAGLYLRLLWALWLRKDHDLLTHYYRWRDTLPSMTDKQNRLSPELEAAIATLFSRKISSPSDTLLTTAQRSVLKAFVRNTRRTARQHKRAFARGLGPLNPR